MNYDFKANWDTIILPLLNHPKVKKSIKKGIISYINDGNCSEDTVYECDKCPAFYQRGDGWAVYIDDYEEKLTEKLLETGYLKKDENEPLNVDEMDKYYGSENFDLYENYKSEIIKPFIKYHEKTSLRAYQMFGACHWWNPTFSLTLAKMIYPNEKWIVKRGFYHTTIVNKNESLVFDILYFDENDETKGGKVSIYDASKKKCNIETI
jgi:hypothetical protein